MNKKSNANVAIIFNCHFNGLSIIQELGQKGIQCIAMDTHHSIGTYSKYAKYQKCPDPLYSEKEFIDFLYNYCKKFSVKPFLFPTNDHWATALSKHKDKISQVSIPCVADWDTINLLINKNLFYEIGEEREYLTPRSWDYNSIKKISKNDFPIIAKPIFRRNSSDDDSKIKLQNMDRLRFTIFNNINDLNLFLAKENQWLPNLIFQEYIHGMSDSMYTVGIYANKDSEVIGLFTGHKVRGYPAESGDCIVGESAELPDYVINNSIRIVKELQYTGIAEFEYKNDTKTNEFKLIEVNPRSWSWIGITSHCGVNLPLIAYNDLCGNTMKFSKNTVDAGSVKYIKILEDLPNCLFNYNADYPQWDMSFAQWKKSLNAKKIIYAEFNANEKVIPLISIYKNSFRIFFNLIKKIFRSFMNSH